MTSEEKAQLIVQAADEKQARDMTLLDLRGLTLMTDYFFICCGTSSTQIRTIVDSVMETMKHAGMGGIRTEGYDAAQWVLMDYGDVVVHVMEREQRDYFRLEEFWKDAKEVPVEPLLEVPLTVE
jgi:ribosome-associated protein